MTRSACIALLCGTGQPRLRVMDFITEELIGLLRAQVPAAYFSISGNSSIPQARNWAVTHFMKATTATDLIFIDDDNYGQAGTFKKLLSYDVEVVGAPCRGKTDNVTWPVRFLTDVPIKRAPNGLVEVEAVGTGLMRITRSCIETMIEANPLNWYHDKNGGGDSRSYALFRDRIKDYLWIGEDIGFCLDWRKIGGKVWIDPDIVTHHIGNQTFSGNPTDWLANGAAVMGINRDPVTVVNEFAA